MPSINEQGQVLQGNGGPISVDGSAIAPLGTCAQWWNSNTAVYQVLRDGMWQIELQDVRVREPIQLSAFGCNFLAARKGCWGAWNNQIGLFGTVAQDTAAGLAPCGTDGRGAVASNGAIAVKPSYQSDGPIEIVPPGGKMGDRINLRINGSPNGLFLLDAYRAVWDGGNVLGMDPPVLLPGAVNIKCVVSNSQSRWWIYWADDIGLVAHRDNGLEVGYLLARSNAYHHAAIIEGSGRLSVAWSIGVQELPNEGRIVDVWSLPTTDLTKLVAQPITPVNAKKWLAWFEFGTTRNPAPHNGELTVSDFICRDVHGTAFAQYVAVELQGNTPAAYEEAIAMARKRNPTLPVIAYVPWQVQQSGYVPSCDWPGAEMYKLNSETLIQAENRWRAYVTKCPGKVAAIAQCYTSNKDQTQDLKSLVPVYSRILHDCASVVGAFPFSNSGRATGLNDHPEVVPLWQELFDTITGPPAIELIKPPVIPPVDPPEGEMAVISDEQFQAMCKDVGTTMHQEMPHVTAEEWEQGARQWGDKARKPKSQGGPERNPTAQELMDGALLRSGFKGVDDTEATHLFDVMEPINARYLYR